MKFLFSIFFLIVFQFSYAQIGVIKTNHSTKVGKIEKCIINKKNKEKCDWIARLSYKSLSSQTWYTLKYKTQYDASGSKQKAVVRKITFPKNQYEVHYVYKQIKDWKSNTDIDKPEKIKLALGVYTLEVSERRSGIDHELYFVFERKEEERDENVSANGLLFNAEDLEKLFGIEE